MGGELGGALRGRAAAAADGSRICAFIPLYEGEVMDIFLTD